MSETGFCPGPDTARQFRDALGCYATGVTVVTTQTDQGPLAMTANSFSSLSMDPPLVLWSPGKSSSRFHRFVDAQRYAIHVMAEDQNDLALHFAKNGDAFDQVEWALSDAGVPILAGCLARFECRQITVHDAGDHAIIVGQVDTAFSRTGRGLIFKQGRYGGFAGRS